MKTMKGLLDPSYEHIETLVSLVHP